MPEGVDISDREENHVRCPKGILAARRPADIAAQVWYPAKQDSNDVLRPVPDLVSPRGGRFPLILYAHAKRRWLTCPEHIPAPLDTAFSDYSQDFRRADRMLSQLASQGFVVAAPDLGWLVETFELGDWTEPNGLPRARILRALHQHLLRNARNWRVDFERIGLIGHSTGGAAVLSLLEMVPQVKFVGLIAPGGPEHVLAKSRRSPATMVIAASIDLQLVHDPVDYVYKPAPNPKVLVRMEGANHLGFTDLCSEDNRMCMDGDPPGLMDRATQQNLAASYLSAMARLYLLGDKSAEAVLRQATEAQL